MTKPLTLNFPDWPANSFVHFIEHTVPILQNQHNGTNQHAKPLFNCAKCPIHHSSYSKIMTSIPVMCFVLHHTDPGLSIAPRVRVHCKDFCHAAKKAKLWKSCSNHPSRHEFCWHLSNNVFYRMDVKGCKWSALLSFVMEPMNAPIEELPVKNTVYTIVHHICKDISRKTFRKNAWIE